MDIEKVVLEIGQRASKASEELGKAASTTKNQGLIEAANAIRSQSKQIVSANHKDLENTSGKGLSKAMIDRLKLDDNGIEAMAVGLEEIAKLEDPVGNILDSWERPNGLAISRITVPLGVIGVIYESRPNVTADAGGLCLKSGNAVILRGGSESYNSSTAILNALRDGLRKVDLPLEAIQMVPTTDRSAVHQLLGLSKYIDVIVPRGGKGLIEAVQTESKIPVFAHLEGICHTYINEYSDPMMACDIVLNGKMRRTGICGATETLLIDMKASESHLPSILDALIAAGCEIKGDKPTQGADKRVKNASELDWSTEYLDSIISIKQVTGVDDAIMHINRYGSEHTDAIVTNDENIAEKFLSGVNSAIVLHNASTQFADGGEFGMGAEIGIATGKLHARGPIGLEQLTTFKYVVRGNGQVRP
ncbi:MAG: Gamma-glutamyl phosphate reductase [Alphaproteobacteria bacterium MarineAlpha3_Bin7]|nr:MAG: Gamma-glutamyl phosphate reductase [Alphaproteobacteria bacterium MarineAlpha3_Bin7]